VAGLVGLSNLSPSDSPVGSHVHGEIVRDFTWRMFALAEFAIRMSPGSGGGTIAMPNGLLRKRPPCATTVWLWPGGWLGIAGFTRITPPWPPSQHPASTTRRSPAAAIAMPTGRSKWRPDDTPVWPWAGGWLGVAGVTRVTPPVAAA